MKLIMSLFLVLTANANAADPASKLGLRAGERIDVEITGVRLFSKSQIISKGWTSKKLFVELHLCVLKPKNPRAAQYTVPQCQKLLETKYWTLSARNHVGNGGWVAKHDWTAGSGPSFTLEHAALTQAMAALNPNGEYPAHLRADLRDARYWNSTEGSEVIDLPVRGHWKSYYPPFGKPEVADRIISPSGKQTAAYVWLKVRDAAGKAVLAQ